MQLVLLVFAVCPDGQAMQALWLAFGTVLLRQALQLRVQPLATVFPVQGEQPPSGKT
jgi:hypothetical protein